MARRAAAVLVATESWKAAHSARSNRPDSVRRAAAVQLPPRLPPGARVRASAPRLRESLVDAARARLARSVRWAVPDGIALTAIDNSGTLDDAGRVLVALLEGLARS